MSFIKLFFGKAALSLLCVGLFNSLQAQWSFGVTIGGLAFHQGHSANADLYKLKLDKHGHGVFFGGITFSVAYRINPIVGIRTVQSVIFFDSAGKLAGISHVGLVIHDDLVGMKSVHHQFSTSIGPFWYYRKGWTNIESYQNDPSFITLSKNGKWENKYIWFGGFMQYHYSLNENSSFAIDFLPGYPFVYASSFGLGFQ